jgi:hypothetical protein
LNDFRVIEIKRQNSDTKALNTRARHESRKNEIPGIAIYLENTK